MNARHAARELALLTLFQLDRQGNGKLDPQAARKENLRELVLSAVRALSAEAEDQIRNAANDLANVSRSLIEYELEHPTNVNSPMEALVKPVPIPTTREMVDKIEKCLQAAEFLFEALRIPELVALAGTEDVQNYAYKLMEVVANHRDALDESLNEYMTEWRMDRLTKMDAYILRVAAAEMKHISGVDLSVSINEAVDLAKQFSGEESYKLVNGVLGAYAERVSSETGKLLAGVNREMPIT